MVSSSKPFAQSPKGQSTTEYLVIVGVVVILSLVVVGVAVGLMSSGSLTNLNSNRILWQSQPVGLSEVGADQVGDTFFVVTNNTGEDITLLGYVANGVERDFTNTTPLVPRGEKKVVFIARQEACGGNGNTCSLSGLSFKYRSASGLDKVSAGNDLIIEKQNDVSIAMFASNPAALVCVNNGDVGQCGNSSDTNAWTAGIISDQNKFLIDLNTSGVLRSDSNYLCDANTCYKISDLNISSSGGGLFTNPLTVDLNINKSGAQLVLVNPDTNYYSRLDRNSLNNTLQLRNNSFTQGAPGKAIDCVTGTVNASGTIPDNTGDFTIAAWIYIPSALNRNGIDIVGTGTLASSTGYAIQYHWNTTTRLGVRVNGTNGGTYGAYVLPSTATWYFVVATRSGTGANNITGYVNAVPQWNQTIAANPASSTALKIGNNIGSGGAYTFPGYVDEPLIWNRALTPEEITYLYNTTSGLWGDTSKAPWNNGLIAGYHLDEGAGTTALPMVGANNLTLTSAGWTTGKVTSVAFNSEYPIVKTSDGLNALETSQITFGNYSTQYGSKTIYEGLNHTWNILGTPYMNLSSSGDLLFGDSSTSSSHFAIKGKTDQNQFTILANGTQTNDLIQIQTSAGVNIFKIDSKGTLVSNQTTGSYNLLLRDSASGTTSGARNVIVGTTIFPNLSSGNDNTMLGSGTGNVMGGTSSGNTAIGSGSLYTYNSAVTNYNTAVGYFTGHNISSTYGGQYNSLFGSYAGGGAYVAGSYGTYLGAYSGYNLWNEPGRNVYVGAFSGYNRVTDSNVLIIDNQNRGSIANENANSLIVGQFGSAAANQYVTINGDLNVSGVSRVATGGSANHAVCWKADGKTLGYCSTVVAADGSCTCN